MFWMVPMSLCRRFLHRRTGNLVALLVVRPRGASQKTQPTVSGLSAPEILGHEWGAGVALLADEFVVGDVPPALGDRAVWRRSAVVRRPGLWFAFI